MDENIAAGHESARRRARRRFALSARSASSRSNAATPAASRSSRTLLQDLRYTLRSLRPAADALAAAVLSIAVAVGANTAIFSLASELMFAMPSAHQPRPAGAHPDGRRQPRLASPVAGARRERRARGPDRLQHRNQRQLARTGPDHQPDADGGGRQFLRCDRRPVAHSGGGSLLRRRRRSATRRWP